ncbi:uncharacterized protein LOC135467960 [Liolophura sinensis]|uniref:uncharacterized protein LOC135467960 n=1 Tax=Liolophura sinensis TaxID=3198878 RepID=UPI0031584CB4
MGWSMVRKLYSTIVGISLLFNTTEGTAGTASEGFVYMNTTETDLQNENGVMPETLNITVESNGSGTNENLKLIKSAVDINAPVFVICEDGKSICRQQLDDIQDFALYQDSSKKAAISIAKEPNAGGGKTVKVEGSLLLNDVQYAIEDIGVNTVENLNSSVPYRLQRIHLEDAGLSDFKILDQPVEHGQIQGRVRRQSSGNYGVELLPVIDYKIFQTWFRRSKESNPTLRDIDTKNKIRKYFAHVVNGMDLRYRAIQANDFQIYIKLAGYLIADRADSSPWTSLAGTGNEVNADTALDQFFDWRRSVRGLPVHDHATLFTGHDLYTLNNRQERMLSVTGYAYLGRVCDDLSVSIVEDKGGFGCVKTATHELGHSLGASHDGDRNSCQTKDQFIMAGSSVPTSDINKLNPWKFSSCSIQAFRTKLTDLNRFRTNCLSNVAETANRREWDAHLSRHPGQLYSVDDVCRQVLGPSSYMCRDLLPSDANVCTSLWCHINGTNQCRQYVPPRGTSCGSQKWCIDGVCTTDARAPFRKDGCTFGDQPGIAYQEETCAQIVRTKPRYCYENFIKQRCCQACSRVYTSIPGCEYGNRQARCESWWCTLNNRDTPFVKKQCCGTCQIGQPVPTTQSPTFFPVIPTKPIPDLPGKVSLQPPSGCLDKNEQCGIAVARHGSQNCYSPDFYSECCLSCEAERQEIPGCGYGDKDSEKCSIISSDSAAAYCNNQEIRDVCCKACGSFQTRESQTASSATGHDLTLTHFTIILITAFAIVLR